MQQLEGVLHKLPLLCVDHLLYSCVFMSHLHEAEEKRRRIRRVLHGLLTQLRSN
jgi:hypothetical protein